jgi:hypothetical protein
MSDLPPIHPVRWVVTAVVIAIELVAAATLPWLFYLRSVHSSCVRGNELAGFDRRVCGTARARFGTCDTGTDREAFDKQTEDAFKPHPC